MIRFTDEQYAAHQKRAKHPTQPVKKESKPSKMRNRKCVTEHGTFDSEKEARRYGELLMLEKAGKIHYLFRQKRFDLVVKGTHICQYVADFYYFTNDGKATLPVEVVEDVKPTFKTEASRKAYQRTDAYRRFVVKKNLMLAVHGIVVVEV